MKIIGKRNDGFIVDIGKSELEKLTGFYYGKSEFFIGQEIMVDSLYNQLNSLINQNDEIKKIAHTLKTAARMLNKIDPIFYKETGS